MRAALQKVTDDSQTGGTLQFQITGDNEQAWIVDLPKRSVTEGTVEQPDATLTIRDEHLALITRGKLDPQIAFVQGKLRVAGDVRKAIEFGAFLPGVAR